MKKTMTLDQALHLARTGKSERLVLAATSLEGLPEGGWPETEQAKMEIRGYLHGSGIKLREWVQAAYYVDGARRYRSRLYRPLTVQSWGDLLAREIRELRASRPVAHLRRGAQRVEVTISDDGDLLKDGAEITLDEIRDVWPEGVEHARRLREACETARLYRVEV